MSFLKTSVSANTTAGPIQVMESQAIANDNVDTLPVNVFELPSPPATVPRVPSPKKSAAELRADFQGRALGPDFEEAQSSPVSLAVGSMPQAAPSTPKDQIRPATPEDEAIHSDQIPIKTNL